MRPDLLIVARAASEQAVPKLLQAGADRVVNLCVPESTSVQVNRQQRVTDRRPA